jgi:ribonucleoside-diphosphate reductase alpha chain
MYYAGISESIEMAKERGFYETFPGSPASEGYFQFDLWDRERYIKNIEGKGGKFNPVPPKFKERRGDRYDWGALRTEMTRHGLRHSYIFARMPTASSANLIGASSSFEPYDGLIYLRSVLSGQFIITNKYLIKDLEEIDYWNDDVVKHIIKHKSLNKIPEISSKIEPDDIQREKKNERLRYLKRKYRTSYELSQKLLANYQIKSGEYVCQSSSFNVHFPADKIKFNVLNSMHFYCWENGLKTGMYYLRQQLAGEPVNPVLNSISNDET